MSDTDTAGADGKTVLDAEATPATEQPDSAPTGPGADEDTRSAEAGDGAGSQDGTPESADTAEAAPAPMPGRLAILLMVVKFTVRRFAVPIVALIAIVAIAAAVILAWQLHRKQAVDDASAAALAAARAYAVTLTSVDSGNLDRDFTAVLDGSTGEFRDMYTRSSGQLRTLLQDNKATGKGVVLEAAVKSASESEVEVLLFIDQTVTNAASTDPRVDRSRVLMTMRLVDGRWLASRVYLP